MVERQRPRNGADDEVAISGRIDESLVGAVPEDCIETRNKGREKDRAETRAPYPERGALF